MKQFGCYKKSENYNKLGAVNIWRGGLLEKLRFNVTGMTCSACSARVEKAVNKIEGTSDVSVNLLTGKLSCKIDDAETSQKEIMDAVIDAGYGISLEGATGSGQAPTNAGGSCGSSCSVAASSGMGASNVLGEEDEVKGMFKRLTYSLAILIPMMVVTMGPMVGIPMPENTVMLRTILQFVMLVPILFLNRNFFIHGFKNLWRRSPNMDSLIAVGSGACTVYGLYVMFRMAYLFETGQTQMASHLAHELYFESAAMVPVLITLGKYFETRSKKKTTEAIEALMDLVPDTAILVKDGKEVEIPVANIVLGDILSIKPGMRIPVDGVVESGHTSIDESVVTGESIPVSKEKGDQLISASQNQNGHILMKATKVGEDTTIAKIIALVDEASSSKAPIARLADKIAGVFVPIVIGISLFVIAVWLIAGYEMSTALNFAVSVLVISCPCALGLATPVAIMVGTGKGAQLGILIKSGDALETLHEVECVLFDKTGTLTVGKPFVTEVISLDPSYTEEDIVSIVGGLEKASEHPLGQAIIDYAEQSQIDLKTADDAGAIPGKGIAGKIECKPVMAGNRRLLEEEGIDLSKAQAQLEDLSYRGRTQVLAVVDGKLVGSIGIMDVPKPESAEILKGLHDLGIKAAMVTGDHKGAAQAIAQEIGIDQVFSEVLPQDKEEYVRKLQDQGNKVAMVGDGINDAPALARADVGIAIGAGTEVAVESADIVLAGNNLDSILSSIRLSKAVIRNIKQNLFWAFFYNVSLIPLAAGVLFIPFGIKLNPMIAAAAMSLSSICVVSNALRLKRFKTTKSSSRIEAEKKAEEKAQVQLEAGQASWEEGGALSGKENGKESEDEMVEKTYEVTGMMCPHCEASVKKALEGVGAKDVLASHTDNKVTFKVDQAVDESRLKEAIVEAGYEVK